MKTTTIRKRTIQFARGRNGGDRIVLKDLVEDMKRRPDKYFKMNDENKKNKRTRKRVTDAKQTYVYAREREQQQQKDGSKRIQNNPNSPIYQARELGMMNAAGQHCDTSIPIAEPKILGKVRVGQDIGKADSYAYIIEKPIGWAILGGLSKKRTNKEQVLNNHEASKKEDDDGNDDFSLDNIADSDMLKIMTTKEIEEYKAETKAHQQIPPPKRGKSETSFSFYDDDYIDMSFSEERVLSSLTPEKIAQMEKENSSHRVFIEKKTKKKSLDASTPASFRTFTRSSVVNWLKDWMSKEQGSSIRGGNYWKAAVGATSVDDSGLVVICPKDKMNNLFINYVKYIAVVGNGRFFAQQKDHTKKIPKDHVGVNILSKVKRGRSLDQVSTVEFTVVEDLSNCNHVVQACQEQLSDGIRGDPAANPFDRRAPRRLIHCNEISISSLAFDDDAELQSESFPDDITIVADRRHDHCFTKKYGSFLGRAELAENSSTNAYREINGAADGFPGWIVDRYDKWLLVQHDDKFPRGPLPSIHNGHTIGVYYLNTDQNRGMMGQNQEIRPILLEGQPMPNSGVQIQENGVTYLVFLDKDLSTGIFLDQRLQRGWLTCNCNQDTRILNCFAHCGAFSVAAASTGASTLSLDLNNKFLERIPTQLRLNGIDYDDRHDSIYGDCFDWLARLSKRGETFDIIILDPPSTSIGTKKKRWSVKNNMAELISLAAPMVKRGGFLWTTTNSATIHPIKFANMCRKGLLDAGLPNAKLERICPMPGDFPSIGTPSVKNLIWKIQ